ncbi:MAG: cytochrome d ubiquinol oxidase subunit II [Syntrophorhabdales bacterium]|jgi:cytochrome d ubiquinol oxidase subunit II
MAQYLPELWIILIVLFLLYYAITDGFDLGIGIISLFISDPQERGILISSIKGVWSANQTWLVVLGGMLFGAFPLFYSVLLSALYIPILIMLFGLIFRGIAIDLGEHFQHHPFWHLSFGLGSLITTAAQGFALGGLLAGLEVRDGRFAGSVWGWVNPFAALISAGVLLGYTMLGGSYLVWKLEGALAEKGRNVAIATSVAAGLISAATWVFLTLRYPFMAEKFGLWPEQALLVLFPALALLSFVVFLRAILTHRGLAPLLWNAAIILFSFLGLSVGLWPHMIPSRTAPITFHEAAGSGQTLIFMLIVMVVLTPVILIYNQYQYWVFRGKMR